jgi:hypothetical protein
MPPRCGLESAEPAALVQQVLDQTAATRRDTRWMTDLNVADSEF